MSADNNRIAAIQQALQEAGLDGWLFYDFRGSDPLAARILKLDPARHMTRRWYYLIPAPRHVAGRIELQDADRKSTRLNSSHANISYAVFCLKKKKKETRVIVSLQ